MPTDCTLLLGELLTGMLEEQEGVFHPFKNFPLSPFHLCCTGLYPTVPQRSRSVVSQALPGTQGGGASVRKGVEVPWSCPGLTGRGSTVAPPLLCPHRFLSLGWGSLLGALHSWGPGSWLPCLAWGLTRETQSVPRRLRAHRGLYFYPSQTCP